MLQGGDYQAYISAPPPRRDGRARPRHRGQVECAGCRPAGQAVAAAADEAGRHGSSAGEQAYAAQQAESAQLQTSRAAKQKELAAKQLQLATLSNQRAQYVAYQRSWRPSARRPRRAAEQARDAVPQSKRLRPNNNSSSSSRTTAANPQQRWRRRWWWQRQRAGRTQRWRLDRGQGSGRGEQGAEPTRRPLRLGRRQLLRPDVRRELARHRWLERQPGLRLRLLRVGLVRLVPGAPDVSPGLQPVLRGRFLPPLSGRLHAWRPACSGPTAVPTQFTTSPSTSATATSCRPRTPVTWFGLLPGTRFPTGTSAPPGR